MLFPVCLILAILQASLAFPANPTETLFGQLTKALPLKEIQELKASHLKNDIGFQAAIKHMKSPEWIAAVGEVRKTPEWIEYKKFVKDTGLDVDYLIQHLEHCINNTDVSGLKLDGVKPSLTSFLDDLKMTYGIQILKGVQGFMENADKSVENRKLKEQMMSPKSKELLEKAMKQPALVNFTKKLQEVGVNLDNLLQMIYSIMEKP